MEPNQVGYIGIGRMGSRMAKRLMDANPNSFRKMVANFLEANGRGYWETSEENIERLKELYLQCEDKLEGIEN